MFDAGREIRLHSSALTNTGRVRENNEDSTHLWNQGEYFVLAIVADGMGGAAAGEEASRIAVETIHEKLIEQYAAHTSEVYDSLSADVLSDRLRDVIRLANDRIVQHAINNPEFKGMGTTITMALVRNTYAVIGHVGDSRAYLVDGQDGTISQITADHSFVEAMVAAGHISREDAEQHPMKNVLYRALGQAEEIDVDVYHSYLRVGDRMVLCSDGLTLHVQPTEIAKVVLSDHRPEVISQRLIDMANERGGRDNVSVVVISVEEATTPHPETVKASDYGEDDTLILRDRKPFVLPDSTSSVTLDDDVEGTSDSPKDGLLATQHDGAGGGSASYDSTNPIVEGRDLLNPEQ